MSCIPDAKPLKKEGTADSALPIWFVEHCDIFATWKKRLSSFGGMPGGLGSPPREPAPLLDILLLVRRESQVLTAQVDLEQCFRQGGGTRVGTIPATRFMSTLVSFLPRIHWTDEIFAPLLSTYACGYSSSTQYQSEFNIESAVDAAASISWKDFVDDVLRAEAGMETQFSPTSRRKLLESKFESRFGAKVTNPDELHYDDRL